ncbi:MAG TPA: hypothetical protein VJ965_02475 [Anaerolineales bacterium]|nr:hypothetical protein [Anaerolineales bacterium]
MDPLTIIVAAMASILFGWIGYALGNFFPVSAKAKKAKEKRSRMRELEGREPGKQATNWLLSNWRKFVDWVLEREVETEDEEEIVVPPTDAMMNEDTEEDTEEPAKETTPQIPAAPVLVTEAQQPGSARTVLIDTPKMAGEDPLVLWHNKRSQKLFAKLGNDIFDLDSELSPSQHGDLSLLLVDLQERVGISATLRDAIAEGTDKVMTEKERKQAITPPGEEPLEKPSFNPIKSFVNYVRADAPKLEEHTFSIPEQIDAFLQANLAGTPLENQGISVRQWPGRGVVFIVGLDVYEDLHKVPNPEIRDQIRKAVKQWEASQEADDD